MSLGPVGLEGLAQLVACELQKDNADAMTHAFGGIDELKKKREALEKAKRREERDIDRARKELEEHKEGFDHPFWGLVHRTGLTNFDKTTEKLGESVEYERADVELRAAEIEDVGEDRSELVSTISDEFQSKKSGVQDLLEQSSEAVKTKGRILS